MTDKLHRITLLVTGGREYDDLGQLNLMLSKLHEKFTIDVLVEGGATGADHLAKMWALLHKIDIHPFAANWKLYGNMAGSVRNSKMLREGRPDLVLAFPGDVGTADMVSKSLAAMLRVFVGKWSNGPGSKIRWEMIDGRDPI